jgi:CheY-like chemotaxis protein
VPCRRDKGIVKRDDQEAGGRIGLLFSGPPGSSPRTRERTADVSVSLLVALSDERSLKRVGGLLKRCGYEVEAASTGIECMAKFCKSPPEVLILDQELNWGNSAGILALMRTADEVPTIPVVLITSEGLDQLPDAYLTPPIVRWIRKPIDPLMVQKTVRSMEQVV